MPPNIQIRTFGRFEVRVDGLTVSTAAWQSRQARDLLRMLVCRRGRATPRDQLCEHLWPDQDPDRTRHRLSVLLSIVRGVIGPSALIADHDCVALNSDRVHVDVEQFLGDVGDAVALYDQGAFDDARTLLEAAVCCYTDEPFADTPYHDATTPLRDQAQVAYLQALRLLADLCRREGKHDQAVTHLWTLLHNDRYDEHAYRTLLRLLVRTGRHGQARRAAARYRAAMADLGLPSQPVERLLESSNRAAS